MSGLSSETCTVPTYRSNKLLSFTKKFLVLCKRVQKNAGFFSQTANPLGFFGFWALLVFWIFCLNGQLGSLI